MKKKNKQLVIIAVFLLLLLGVYFLASHFINQHSQEPEEDSSVAVSQIGAENITAFSYSSEDTNNEFLEFYREKDVWYYKEDKEFPLNQTFVTAIVKSAADVSANRKLEVDVGELSEYGLDNPAVTVRLQLKDNSKQNLYIGNYNQNAESYYLRIDGDDSIYLVEGTLKLNFSMGLYDLVKLAKFPLVEENSFVHVKLENEETVMEIKGTVEDNADEYISGNYVEKEKTWLVSSNGSDYQLGNQTNLKALIQEMSAYSFYREVNYKASAEDLSLYGLDDPAIKLTVDYQVLDETTARVESRGDNINEVVMDTLDKQYVLHIGDGTADTNYAEDYYVRLEGSDIIYTMEKSTLNSILDLNVVDYLP